MDQDGGLGTLAARAPDVNASKSTTLNGSTSRDDLRLRGESALKVAQEGQVISICMVRSEPGFAGDYDS